ncbi:hypothetical protein [Streptomyces sp. SLBN-31]|uniref:hypothetical protein n=1 Tax=Streptomyces sp. SLBN-31 TaxID=2768444 RepID=UPI0021B35498|nr:hypothetical protein [Streptomyces sp. SLBN-31]
MRGNTAIWTAAVVSAALTAALGTAGEASAATRTLVVAVGGDAAAPGTLTSALGPSTVSKGNSWDLGGTWNASSVLSADPAPLTGPRAADGSLPSAPSFLVPRNGADIGARF